jgi:hypothetical protein
MIGVAVQPDERAIVSEFFELFKTPWEFYRSDRQYDVVLCTSNDFPSQLPRLVVILEGRLTPFDATEKLTVQSRPGGVIVSDEGKRLPIYGALGTFPGSPCRLLAEESTQEPAAFVTHCGRSTILRVGYNLFEEVRFLLTVGQPVSNAGIPTLDEHISWLRDWINLAGIPSVEIPPVPDGHNFIACLTHDIDHPALRNHFCDHTMFGFLYRSIIGTWLDVYRARKPAKSLWKNWRAACLLPFVHLGLAKDFWSEFDRYLEIEAGHGSTFFVIPRKGYTGRTVNGLGPAMRASRYDLDEVSPQLQKIISKGCEVGVHGLDAWLDGVEGRKELEKVAQAVLATELGVRMHWLYFNESSPRVLEQAGFTYDSTVGYCETAGYRAGTAQVYRPPGAHRLLELPLHVMDTALFYPHYLNLSQEQAERIVWGLISDVQRVGGALTINWHDRSIAPERLWDDFYLRLLSELKSRGAWLPNAAVAVDWFRRRRSAAVESSWSEGGALRVRGCLETADTLPGLKIRVHKPRAQSLTDPIASRTAATFVDMRFDRTTELKISI